MSDLANIDWLATLDHLTHFATSSEAKDHLKATSPLGNQKEAETSLEKIVQAQKLLASGQRPYMESVDYYPAWFYRLKKNALLKPIEFKDIRLFLMEVQNLKKETETFANTWLKTIHQNLMKTDGLLSHIDQIMDTDGQIRTDASEALYKLYSEKKQIAGKIQNTLDTLVKGHEFESSLQDKYVTNREGRWVIPIKSGMRHNLEGIIHAASASRQTVFMEPQVIIPLNNRTKQIEIEIEKEIEKLLRELSDSHFLEVENIEHSKNILVDTDVYLAKGQFANVTSATPCLFTKDSIGLESLKHPLMIINGENVIPNSLELSPSHRVLLLSGPNAGGKTVLLKAFGLAAHMARCGLPICAAPGSKIPFFDSLVVSVGDNQSVDDNLSTFASHLLKLNEACGLKGGQSLVLIDEICGSTDPAEGAALARSFLYHYSQANIYGLITSHLGPLKVGWNKDSGVINGSMNYDETSGRATYQFIPGVPGQSLAFATARKCGVAESVYQKAVEFLSPVGQKFLESSEQVDQLKIQALNLKQQLKEQIEAYRNKETELIHKLELFENEKNLRLEKEVKHAIAEMEENIKNNNLKDIFNRHESNSSIEKSFPKIIKFSSSQEKTFDTIEAFCKAFPPGRRIFVKSLNRDAIVQGLANHKGEIPILAGSMRVLIPWKDLTPPRQTENPINKTGHRAQKAIFPQQSTIELDLRGNTVEQAMESLENQLDRAIQSEAQRVKVIHGNGSEALKKAVRSQLSRSIYVSRWQVGIANEGGDGITWAYIADEINHPQ